LALNFKVVLAAQHPARLCFPKQVHPMNYIGRLWCLALLSFFFLATSAIANSNTYDYIVVGSGPGGGTLAANLAKAGQSILLLEACDGQGNNLNEEIAGWFFLCRQ
jgi:choline dehydrogenase